MNDYLDKACNGDINAFQQLFGSFQDELKSYLFRLLASRADAEDIAHDTFIRGFDKINTYRRESSFKTWIFQIATNLAFNTLKKRKRWVEDVKHQSKQLVMKNAKLREEIATVNRISEFGKFEIREHISTCFTCMGKNLPIENQIVLILKDIYDFPIKEIMAVLGETEGRIKYFLQTARKTLTDIFERRCALINKKGICNQCSELNGWFNPKQDQQEAKMKIRMVKEAEHENAEKLLQMRTALVKHINPLKSDGNELQEALLNCNRMVMGEI